jgi:hypothetical protein
MGPQEGGFDGDLRQIRATTAIAQLTLLRFITI